ncbi:DarT ssDNA thymidine ADP-ribosyltransferase family protein [Virgibacillus sp. W0181]|uniref:DarT ssDNA thymidine ADP-ribosyltransferase family protein n=1 Tax=Virgibacillus sp. W0181 TaxID=3391581 RepID=UPI003F44DAC3
MALDNVKEQKLLYHLTKLSNLESILEYGLISREKAKRLGITFSDVADSDIISQRALLGLEEYVPFHFHPYSAFDTAVKSRYAEDVFIYICLTREKAMKNKFKVLPMHPLSDDFELYEYEEGFNLINWDFMRQKGNEEKLVKHTKMAECLTTKTVPAKHFHSIAVPTQEVGAHVQSKLKAYGIIKKPPYVDEMNWF